MVTYLTGYRRVWRELPVLEHIKARARKAIWFEHTFGHPYAMLMFEGSGKVCGAGWEVEMEPPFVLIARPGARYAYGPDQEWVEQGLCFDTLEMPAEWTFLPDRPFPMRESLAVAAFLDQMDALLESPAAPGVPDQLDLLARLAVTTALFGSGRDTPKGPEERLYALEKWLRTHFFEPFEIAEVIRRFGFSQPTFRRLWRKRFPESPWQHVLSLRVHHAQAMLRERPDMTIQEVADACGFEDQRYFATAFKARTGKRPSDLRQGT